MKKRLLTLVLAAVMLFSTVGAVDTYTAEEKTADALNHLGLFLGKSSGNYALEDNLNRNQGAILLVRMLGKEAEAKTGNYSCSFTDLPGGAAAHVAYAYTNGIINGYNTFYFGGSDIMTDKMFLALTLRALGYSDKDGRDFSYHQSRQMAYSLGLVDDAAEDSNFTRGEAVEVFWRTLQQKLNGEDMTLVQRLIEQGVFTSKEYTEACNIQANGRDKYQGVPAVPEEDEPEEPAAPEEDEPEESEEPDTPEDNEPEDDDTGSSGSATPSTPTTPDSGDDSGSGTTPDGGDTPTLDANTPATAEAYEAYQAMSGEAQMTFFEQFDDPMAFFTWLNEAKAAYDAAHPSIEIGGDGSVNLGDIIGGGN